MDTAIQNSINTLESSPTKKHLDKASNWAQCQHSTTSVSNLPTTKNMKQTQHHYIGSTNSKFSRKWYPFRSHSDRRDLSPKAQGLTILENSPSSKNYKKKISRPLKRTTITRPIIISIRLLSRKETMSSKSIPDNPALNASTNKITPTPTTVSEIRPECSIELKSKQKVARSEGSREWLVKSVVSLNYRRLKCKRLLLCQSLHRHRLMSVRWPMCTHRQSSVKLLSTKMNSWCRLWRSCNIKSRSRSRWFSRWSRCWWTRTWKRSKKGVIWERSHKHKVNWKRWWMRMWRWESRTMGWWGSWRRREKKWGRRACTCLSCWTR